MGEALKEKKAKKPKEETVAFGFEGVVTDTSSPYYVGGGPKCYRFEVPKSLMDAWRKSLVNLFLEKGFEADISPLAKEVVDYAGFLKDKGMEEALAITIVNELVGMADKEIRELAKSAPKISPVAELSKKAPAPKEKKKEGKPKAPMKKPVPLVPHPKLTPPKLIEKKEKKAAPSFVFAVLSSGKTKFKSIHIPSLFGSIGKGFAADTKTYPIPLTKGNFGEWHPIMLKARSKSTFERKAGEAELKKLFEEKILEIYSKEGFKEITGMSPSKFASRYYMEVYDFLVVRFDLPEWYHAEKAIFVGVGKPTFKAKGEKYVEASDEEVFILHFIRDGTSKDYEKEIEEDSFGAELPDERLMERIESHMGTQTPLIVDEETREGWMKLAKDAAEGDLEAKLLLREEIRRTLLQTGKFSEETSLDFLTLKYITNQVYDELIMRAF